jgi:FkbM family methyltransferase
VRLSTLVDRLPARWAVPVRATRGHTDAEVAHLHRFVQPGATVLDIGANKGVYAWHLVRLVGATGHVHAFEPQLALASRLRRAGLGRQLSVHPFALSDREASMTLTIPILDDAPEPGHASLEPNVGQGPTVQVPVRTLDSLNLLPSFVKVDIEGHELAMLRGAEATITRSRPVLLLEIDYRHRNEVGKRGQLLDWLTSHSYTLFYVRGAALLPAPALTADIDPNASIGGDLVYNWFALPDPA